MVRQYVDSESNDKFLSKIIRFMSVALGILSLNANTRLPLLKSAFIMIFITVVSNETKYDLILIDEGVKINLNFSM